MGYRAIAAALRSHAVSISPLPGRAPLFGRFGNKRVFLELVIRAEKSQKGSPWRARRPASRVGVFVNTSPAPLYASALVPPLV